MNILSFLIIGILAGWIAGLLMRGHGFGMIGNLVIGVVGAVLGGLLFDLLGIKAYGSTGALAMSVVGAVLLLAFTGFRKKS